MKHLFTLVVLAGCGTESSGKPRELAPLAIEELTACDNVIDGGARTTYYVAIAEPGADNELCDGLAPIDMGGGHCPFRDFTSARVRLKLWNGPNNEFGTHSVTMLIRNGTYTIEPMVLWKNEPPVGIQVLSTATAPHETIVIASYPGETAILDGVQRIGTLMQLFGDHVRIDGLRVQGVHHWNLTIEGAEICVQNNTLTGPSGEDSDSIKSFNGSGPDVVVRNNDLFGGFEQGLDGTHGYGWLIQNNRFHDGVGGVGFKFDARYIYVVDNEFYNLSGKEAVSLGGGGSDSEREYEAQNIVVERNAIHDVALHAAQFNSCKDCSFRDNDIRRAQVGVLALDRGPSGCRNGDGCLPTTGAIIEGNRFREMLGDAKAPPNGFLAVDPKVVADFTAGRNIYCTDGAPVFFFGGTQLLDFPGWQAVTGTDATSTVVRTDDVRCQ